MLLAAGLGARMRPLTDHKPKPLVAVLGKPLIDHALDRLQAANVATVVVNVHYMADAIEAHLAGRARPTILISDERAQLLETGGGILKALQWLGERPFFVMNADSLWLEADSNLPRLALGFDPARMDARLLLAPIERAIGFDGRGDYAIDAAGRLEARGARERAPFVYAGVAVLTPQLFAGAPSGPFSLVRLFARAEAAGRLHGMLLDGTWMHVGSPEAIAAAEALLREKA
jgi:MurNAc alpha-1-phosphate uridylyltransferase